MEKKWAYNLGILCVIIGFIIIALQAGAGFYHGIQDAFTEEAIQTDYWFSNESPMRFFILGAVLVGFYKVLNSQSNVTGEKDL